VFVLVGICINFLLSQKGGQKSRLSVAAGTHFLNQGEQSKQQFGKLPESVHNFSIQEKLSRRRMNNREFTSFSGLIHGPNGFFPNLWLKDPKCYCCMIYVLLIQ